MLPNKKTKFLPIEELKNFTDSSKYCCIGIVFSPETENNHFHGCPPYIHLTHCEADKWDDEMFFEVPEIIAYYGEKHAGYTMRGNEYQRKQGAHDLVSKMKNLLDIQD